MLIVITNSRKYATEKLLAMNVRPPLDHINFVESTLDLINTFDGTPPPSLLLWQRGRMSQDQKQLRQKTNYFFEAGIIRPPQKKELEAQHHGQESNREKSGTKAAQRPKAKD